MSLSDEKLCREFATVAEGCISKLNEQNVANLVWAFATWCMPTEQLFAAAAGAAEQRVDELKSQAFANISWAFARARYMDTKVISVLKRRAERCVGRFVG
eukprot:gnl/TRDRNA2_/TRDRNA2_153244_c0_seq2.p3 gnl/TRDRNA2_/TRDRNA2_153244_c0~~gnl/TRDRNA2_/TRDRNA2_153244_c0_seq2.p3  ORF type:complete len:100 (+),score=19.94 gnl/TRDRNA2_/TRDRNA2_153244_c0_seq2:292-591(+)